MIRTVETVLIRFSLPSMAHTHFFLGPTSPEIVAQNRRLIDAVGKFASDSAIQDLLDFAQDASLPEFYERHSGDDFWYEMLRKDGLPQRVGAIADEWAAVRRNYFHVRYVKLTKEGRARQIYDELRSRSEDLSRAWAALQ